MEFLVKFNFIHFIPPFEQELYQNSLLKNKRKISSQAHKSYRIEFFLENLIMMRIYISEKDEAVKDQDIKLAIIDNAIDHSVYNPIRHWKSCLEIDFDVFKATEYDFPEIRDYTHLILTGSEASILEREKWVEEEAKLINQAVDSGLSLLGSCYGHQLLAVVLAGSECVQRCAQPEIGWIPVHIKDGEDFLGKKGLAYSFSSHFDEVIDLPIDFQVLAYSEHCSVQAFRMIERPVWGLQIHPEMNVSEAQIYLKNRIEHKHEPVELFAQALKSKPKDSGLIRPIARKFLR
jgi:GMP synthase-like glutamine amidotransferase